MAELKYLVHLNLNKNQLINPVVHVLPNAPGTPAEGQIYYDSTAGDQSLHVYNGSAWVRLAGQISHQATDTIASGDFIAFSDESEDPTGSVGNFTNKLTIDNLFKTAPALLSTAAIANGDFIMFLDGGATGETKLEALADVATLFAGAGMTATDSVLNVIGTANSITVTADAIAVTPDQTTITSILNTGLVVGRDATDQIKFSTDNQIIFRVDGADGVKFLTGGEIEATKFDGALEGNASTATALEAAGNIAATGDITWNVDFSGPDATGTAAIGTGVIINTDVKSDAAIAQTKIDTDVDLGGDIRFGDQPNDTVEFAGHVSSSFTSTGSFGVVETPYGVNFTGDNHSDQGAKIFYTNASSEDKIIIQAGTRNMIEIHNPYTGTTGEVVINEDSLTTDFRVESGGNDHMIYSDGNNNKVGIGKNNPTQVLDVNGNVLATSLIAGSTVISDDSIVMTPSTGDTFTITTQASGATTLATVDTDAAEASLTLTVDGKFRLSSTGIDIAENGTISNAVWNGTKIADAYLSDNTAHLTGAQTFSGAKTFGTTTKLLFRDSGLYLNSSTNGQLDIVADTKIQIATPDVTFTSADSNDPIVSIINTNDDATGASLKLIKNTANSAATNDVAGIISFLADDAGNNETEYGRIKTIAAAVTAGSESGKMLFGVATTATGAYADILTITGGANAAGSTVAMTGHLTVAGDLTVTGDTITASVGTLDVEDKNITINKSSGDSSGTADGAGITIQDAVDASNDATILWTASSDTFTFSHPINADVTGDLTGTADAVTNATFTTALTVNTGTLTLTANAADNSVVTIGAGAVGISGTNTGDETQSRINGLAITTVGALDSGTIASGFGAIVATTIDATTDFTIGNLVITDNTLTGTALSLAAGSGEIDLTTTGGVDINAGAITIDGSTVSIDGTDDVNVSVTSSTAGEDLTIAQIGAYDSGILITAAGTGTDAIKIDATAGDMLIAPTLINGKTLKIGPTSATEMVFTPSATAANEKISLTNTSGTAANAIAIVSTAGGITLTGDTDHGVLVGTVSGGPVSIGNTTSETTVNDNLTVTGTLTMGTTAAMTATGLLSVANQSNITGVGTITSGVWNGDAIATDEIADNAVTIDKMAHGTDGNLITYNASGAPAHVATGTAGHVLTSAGAGAPPVFAEATGATYKETLTQNAGGTLTAWIVNHSLSTKDVMVQLYNLTNDDTVYAQVVRTDANNVTVTFNVAPDNDDIRVLISKI